jgi:hypothetical protein
MTETMRRTIRDRDEMNIKQCNSHMIEFSTGKTIYRPFTAFALSSSGVAYCLDGDVNEITIQNLSDIEKAELAELMVERWKKFGETE